MLGFYINQIYLSNWWQLFLIIIIFYNLYQLIRQFNIIYFLGYFLFFITYVGLLLFYYDLDIFCLILWMVYGGLIVVVFLFLLMWDDFTKSKTISSVYQSFLYGGIIIIFSFFFILASLGSFFTGRFSFFLNIEHASYYTFINLDVEEELEVLGWGFSTSHSLGIFFVTILLSLTCFVIVNIIGLGRRVRWGGFEGSISLGALQKQQFKKILLRVQNFFIQERSSTGVPRRILKNFHSRRV